MTQPLTIDLHIDTPWQVTKHGQFDLDIGSRKSMVSTAKLRRNGGPSAVTFALYLSDTMQDTVGGRALSLLLRQVEWLKEQSDWRIALDTAQAIALAADNRIPVFLGLEGGRLLGKDPIIGLRFFKSAIGIKYLTLTHNRNTAWADSATDVIRHAGLTALGRAVVEQAETLGVIVDVSHASDLTILDVLAMSTKPVIASHSACKTLHKHARNLSDLLIKSIAATDGVIGIPFADNFIGPYLVADHIDYAVQLVGPKHVAVGSDIDGAVMVPDVADVSDWDKVVGEPLSRRGYTDETIAAIAGGNVARLFQ